MDCEVLGQQASEDRVGSGWACFEGEPGFNRLGVTDERMNICGQNKGEYGLPGS